MKPEDITLADAMVLRTTIQDIAKQYKNAGFDLEESLALIEGVLINANQTLVVPFGKLIVRREFDSPQPRKPRRNLFGLRKEPI